MPIFYIGSFYYLLFFCLFSGCSLLLISYLTLTLSCPQALPSTIFSYKRLAMLLLLVKNEENMCTSHFHAPMPGLYCTATPPPAAWLQQCYSHNGVQWKIRADRTKEASWKHIWYIQLKLCIWHQCIPNQKNFHQSKMLFLTLNSQSQSKVELLDDKTLEMSINLNNSSHLLEPWSSYHMG